MPKHAKLLAAQVIYKVFEWLWLG